MKDAKQIFGDRVREIRLAHKLSQKKFAQKMGLQSEQLGYIERGQKNCRFGTIAKLAKGLQITSAELMNFDVPYTIETPDSGAAGNLDIFMQSYSDKERDHIIRIVKILYG